MNFNLRHGLVVSLLEFYTKNASSVRNLLIEKSTNPQRLFHLCRISVINCLGLNAHKKVDDLPIPKKIKELIQLQDLEEMCKDINDSVYENTLVKVTKQFHIDSIVLYL